MCLLIDPYQRLTVPEAHHFLRALGELGIREGSCSTFFFSGDSWVCGSIVDEILAAYVFAAVLVADLKDRDRNLLNFENDVRRFSEFNSFVRYFLVFD